MRAVRFHDRRDLRIEEVPEPTGALGANEVLISPIFCGICGSDLHEYVDGPIISPRTPHAFTGAKNPTILGHEFSARVDAVGSAVTNVAVGDRVSIQPQMSPADFYGRKGWYQLSPSFAVVGFSWPWGGMAEAGVVKDINVYKVPDEVSDIQAALVEPAAVAVHAVDRAGVKAGWSVLISGFGPIGALCAMAARAAGATTIIITETNAKRLAAAATLVPESVRVNPMTDNLMDVVRAKTEEGVGVNAAIECAGVAAAVNACIDAVRPQGKIVQLGLAPEPVKLDLLKLVFKDIDLRGVIAYPCDSWPKVMELIASGRFPIEKIVTSIIPLENAVKHGFEALLDPTGSEMKILLDVKRSN